MIYVILHWTSPTLGYLYILDELHSAYEDKATAYTALAKLIENCIDDNEKYTLLTVDLTRK